MDPVDLLVCGKSINPPETVNCLVHHSQRMTLPNEQRRETKENLREKKRSTLFGLS